MVPLSTKRGVRQGLRDSKAKTKLICLIHSNESSPEDAISCNCRSGKAPSHGPKPKEQDDHPSDKTVEILFSVLRAWHDVEAPHAPTNRPLLGDPQCPDIAAGLRSAGSGGGQGQLCTTTFTGACWPWPAMHRGTAVSLTAGGEPPDLSFAGRGARARHLPLNHLSISTLLCLPVLIFLISFFLLNANFPLSHGEFLGHALFSH